MPPNITRATSRDIAAVLRDAEGRGWKISRTRGGHVRLHGPGKALVIAALTPGCPRSARNLAADLRRAERAAAADHA